MRDKEKLKLENILFMCECDVETLKDRYCARCHQEWIVLKGLSAAIGAIREYLTNGLISEEYPRPDDYPDSLCCGCKEKDEKDYIKKKGDRCVWTPFEGLDGYDTDCGNYEYKPDKKDRCPSCKCKIYYND